MDGEYTESLDTSDDIDVSYADAADDIPVDIPDDVPEDHEAGADVPDDNDFEVDVPDDIVEDMPDETMEDMDETEEDLENEIGAIEDIPEDTVSDEEPVQEELYEEDVLEDIADTETTGEAADAEGADAAEWPEEQSHRETYDYETSPERLDAVHPETVGEFAAADNPYREIWEQFEEEFSDGRNHADDWDALKEVPFSGDEQSDHAEYLPEQIKCRNENLEGQEHPETGVPFERKQIEVDNKRYEVVVPEFESSYDAQLPENMYEATDHEQFGECNSQLKNEATENQDLWEQFDDMQKEQIENGDTPDGYTWVRHEVA